MAEPGELQRFETFTFPIDPSESKSSRHLPRAFINAVFGDYPSCNPPIIVLAPDPWVAEVYMEQAWHLFRTVHSRINPKDIAVTSVSRLSHCDLDNSFIIISPNLLMLDEWVTYEQYLRDSSRVAPVTMRPFDCTLYLQGPEEEIVEPPVTSVHRISNLRSVVLKGNLDSAGLLRTGAYLKTPILSSRVLEEELYLLDMDKSVFNDRTKILFSVVNSQEISAEDDLEFLDLSEEFR